MTSIRAKIRLGYYTLAALVGGLAMLSYADLGFLQQRIGEGDLFSRLQQNVLEMRRHEKNYFLYREAGELGDALQLAQTSLRQAQENRALLARLIGASELDSMVAALQKYHASLLQFPRVAGSPAPSEKTKQEIRKLGHTISTSTERLGELERASLAASAQRAQLALFWSLAMVVLLGISGAQILSRLVVQPLRRLENSLKPVAAGRFHELPLASQDQEIRSFTTAFNRMLEELEARQRQILQSEKLASIGVLASGVAHELNNPLGNISGACQILLEELGQTDPTAQREWLEQIDSEAERAKRIVRTLLDYARRQPSRIQRIVLADTLEKTLVLLRSRLPQRDTVQLQLQPDMCLQGDEQILQQVFINLITNALDAGGPAVQITIQAENTTLAAHPPNRAAHVAGDLGKLPAQGRLAVITISDSGTGLPEEMLVKIFDPFFTTRAPGQGIGLGLYVVEEIITAHGGCIGVENRPQGGLVFTLWLPCLAGVQHE